MSRILYPVYYILRLIVRIGFIYFYRRTIVLNRKRLDTKGPLFLLSNHPGTVMDPFNVVAYSRRYAFFLANATLFKNKIAASLLNTLFCIRVERYQDVNDRPLENGKAFDQSIQFLEGGGCLFVAPEGTSEVERRIRKIKTGTARIALAAEAANDFKLGIQILPVGLNYSNPRYFRETVIVSPSNLIQVSDYRDLYKEDPWKAVQVLTEEIRSGLSENIIDTTDDEEDLCLSAWENISQTEYPLPLLDRWRRSKSQLSKIQKNNLSESIKKDLIEYQQFLSRNNISDVGVAGRWKSFPPILGFMLGFPIALLGFINHLLPCGIPWLINRKMNVWPCYDATYRFVAGLITVPVFYYLQIKWASQFMDWWVYAIILLASGIFADVFWRKYLKWKAGKNWQLIEEEHPHVARKWREKRKSIIEEVSKEKQPVL